MPTVSGSASTTTRNPRHWQLAVLVMATLPEIPNRARLFDHLVGAGDQRRWHGKPALAVLRLITSSNLVGSTAGISSEMRSMRSGAVKIAAQFFRRQTELNL